MRRTRPTIGPPIRRGELRRCGRECHDVCRREGLFRDSLCSRAPFRFREEFRMPLASESPRGTNPRCAGRDLWGFGVLAVPGCMAVKCAGLDWMRIARALPIAHEQNSKPLVGRLGGTAGIAAGDDAGATMGARAVVCRRVEATTSPGNEPCRVTTAALLLRDGVAARAAASSA
jgi:hypothetical protein